MAKKYRIRLALFWLFIISVLFCLPGSSIPKNDWLSKIWFDKWVHIGFFVLLTGLWSWALNTHGRFPPALLIICAICYGLIVELVQHYLIPNRSFDLGDLVADAIGAVAGIFICMRYIKK